MVDCLRCEQRFSWFALYRAWRTQTWYCDGCLVEMERLAAELSDALEKRYGSKRGVTPEGIQEFRTRQQQLHLPDAYLGSPYHFGKNLR